MKILKKMLSIVLSALLLLSVIPAVSAAETTDETIKILAIGNSYSNNATEYISRIAETMGKKISVTSLYFAGCNLDQHVKYYNENQQVYMLWKDGAYIYPDGVSEYTMKRAFELDEYDYVTIQQGPGPATDYSTFYTEEKPYLTQLYDIIKANEPNAEIMIHQTWSFALDGVVEYSPYTDFVYDSTLDMYIEIENAYERAAEKLGIDKEDGIIPVGKAIQLAKDEFGYGDCYVYTGSSDAEKVGADALYNDNVYHLNIRGRYLAACVWAEKILGVDCRNSTYVPAGYLTEADCTVLRSIAHEAVTGETDSIADAWRYIANGDGVKITHYVGEKPYGGAVTLPTSINGKVVNAVAATLFKHTVGVEEVTIPDSSIDFEDGAIYNGIQSVKTDDYTLNVGTPAQSDDFAIVEPGIKTYGDATFTLTATGNDGDVTFTAPENNGIIEVSANGQVTILNAGTVKVTATNGDKTDDVNVVVKRKTVKVIVDDAQKYYGEKDPKFTYKFEPALINGDTIEGTLTYKGKAIGNYDIVADEPFEHPNYNIIVSEGEMKILSSPPVVEEVYDDSVAVVWQAEPELAGKKEGDVISRNGNGYSSAYTAKVGKDDAGYYYTFDVNKNGFAYISSGVTSSKAKWIGNSAVITALQPYLKLSYDYKITSSTNVKDAMQLGIYANGGWTPTMANLSTNSGLVINGDWTNYTGNIGKFNFSGDSWSNGYIGFNIWAMSYPATYTFNIRNVRLVVDPTKEAEINAALEGTGYTYTDIIKYTVYSYNATDKTIWQAEPELAGKKEGDVISRNGNGYSSAYTATVGKDEDGYYYTFDVNRSGFAYISSGVTSSKAKWIGNTAVITALQPYLQISYDYRITSSTNVKDAMQLGIYANGGWTPTMANLTTNYGLVINGGWTNYTSSVGAFNFSGDSWSNGYIGFNIWANSYPATYTFDIRNVKITIKSGNRQSIDAALKGTGFTYADLVSYNEYQFGNDEAYTVWQSEPELAGKKEGDVISRNGNGYSSAYTAKVGKDDEGYYYTFDVNRSGFAYISSGVTASKVAWMSNSAVINAIQPYLQLSYDYKITSTTNVKDALELSVYANGGWTPMMAKISYNTSLAINAGWKNYTSSVGKFNFNGDSWSNGYIGFNTWANSYPATYTFSIRNVKLILKKGDKKAIDTALKGTGYTFETITSYEPYEYFAIDTPIWYASPDRSKGATGSENVTPMIDREGANAQAAGRTEVVTENGMSFYRAAITCDTKGGNTAGAYINTGINNLSNGYGWMANKDLLSVIGKYMYVTYDYRFTSESGLPANAEIELRAVNANGYAAKLSSLNISSNGEWTKATSSLIDGSFFRAWNDGYLKFEIVSYSTAFTGTQNVDIANIQLVLSNSNKLEINEELSKISGIDDIAGFTNDVEIGKDANGNNDYYALLASAVTTGLENDLNDDGKFDIRDLVRMKKYSAGLATNMPEFVVVRADSDDNGKLEATDLTSMRKNLLNIK